MTDTIKINRAPVLTLWGAIVAERLGYNHEEALTLGKAVAGLTAQSKGQRLGIYTKVEAELDEKASKKPRERKPGEVLWVEVVGRRIPAVQTEHGLRATNKDEAIDPQSVERYLEKKFGPGLDEARQALEALAHAYPPHELERRAFGLYEQFRPTVPEGVQGWGAVGELKLERIRQLAKTR
ncbi:MAG: hypothetical protein C3F13_13770 [Anaerolineales bacterium]|nr:MAG: hypothetical protein C3F13_13770 [Anaerolineales bacterium]